MKKIFLFAGLLAVGAAVGWFATRTWGGAAVSSKPPYRDATSREDNIGRARSMNAPNVRTARPLAADAAAKPRRKTEARAEKRREPVADVAKPEEKPAQEAQAEQLKNDDNPFPRYLDMFKNNPEALAAEFLKEAEKDRAFQAQRRQEAIAKLNLNAEQAAVFEKALDELRDEITRQNEANVNLIKSGQLNESTAADGRIWESNMLVAQEIAAAQKEAVRKTAEKLYEQLALEGVSDEDKQKTLYWSAYIASHSYECLEPNLDVYDKVYKNMGVGNGIFSWCRRSQQKEKK